MVEHCRFCKAELKTEFADLGMQPNSNNYIPLAKALNPELFFPLITYVCDKCKLVQTIDFNRSDELFRADYAYFSSYSTSWLKHCQDYVNMISKKLNLNEKSQVIEVASNDGYLLQYFKEKNIPCIGVEPCKGVAEVAIAKGIDTRIEFFGEKYAQQLPKTDLILGNNVLAHVPDINDFIAGVTKVLKPNGTVTFEFPHLLNLINLNQFDTIYHEHYSYLSLIFIKELFAKHGLDVYDVEELPTHGGSLRVYGCFKNSKNISDNVAKLFEKEKDLQDIKTYKLYNNKVKLTKRNIWELLLNLKNQGKHIVSYGAAAKGNTLFNYCGIRSDIIDYAVDLNPHKQNTLLPGVHIEVKSPEVIKKTKPDYIIITPWNLKTEISNQLNYAREWGAKFITLIPEPNVF